jgi:predicted nucleic acid-binding protein
MNGIILDTHVVLESKSPAPDPKVRSWFATQDVLMTNVLAELAVGIERLPSGRRRTDFRRRPEALIQEDSAGRILMFDVTAALIYGKLAAAALARSRPPTVEASNSWKSPSSIHGRADRAARARSALDRPVQHAAADVRSNATAVRTTGTIMIRISTGMHHCGPQTRCRRCRARAGSDGRGTTGLWTRRTSPGLHCGSSESRRHALPGSGVE